MIHTLKNSALALSLALFFSANFAHAQKDVLKSKCPAEYETGVQLDKGLFQLTGTHLVVGQHDSNDVPDPAPPYVNDQGEIEIFGSSLSYLRYDSWKDFERGGCFKRMPLNLVQDNLVGYPDAYSRPWDARKFRLVEKNKAPLEVIVAGTMSRTGSRTYPLWPDDNTNRRLFLYRPDNQGRWVRDAKPLVGKVSEAWIGHSYGGNFLQTGMTDHSTIHLDQPEEIAFFYEKVSDDTNNSPYKTEIFATRVRSLKALRKEPEVPIFTINTPAYPSLKRTVGGFLAEGPRPIEMTIGKKKFFVIAFSSGDFPTDSYTLNYIWSRKLLGPYKPALTKDGTDLIDLGRHIKATYGLSWMGRPSIFKSPSGAYEILFHAVRKDIRPDNDYTGWPKDLLGFHRSLFKSALTVGLNKKGEPVLALDPAANARPANRF